jgi:hypothetical protein
VGIADFANVSRALEVFKQRAAVVKGLHIPAEQATSS